MIVSRTYKGYQSRVLTDPRPAHSATRTPGLAQLLASAPRLKIAGRRRRKDRILEVWIAGLEMKVNWLGKSVAWEGGSERLGVGPILLFILGFVL